MKAIFQDRYGETDVLQYGDIERPTFSDDEVLVRVRAAGVDRGVWHLMTGLAYPVRLVYGLRRPKNRVPGMDVAGVVEAVGKNVSRFKPGDEVFGIGKGTFAEYAPALEKKLVHKPNNLTFDQAAVVSISGLAALRAVRDQANVQSGQKVLVIGASGGVGTYAVQIAKAFGAEVTGVASTRKLEVVRSTGSDDVIDYTRDDFADGARQWDVVVDIAGNRRVSQLRRALTAKGTLVIVGGEGGGKWFGGMGRSIGAVLLSPFVGQSLRMQTPKEWLEGIETLKEFTEAGRIVPVIERSYALNEVAEAIKHLEHGNARGKLVISV
jgi:NADPH:quinone reductase-like Zn-dependent oxidoreductase